MSKIKIPLGVPSEKRSDYKKNYKLMTADTGNLFLMAGDQKVEHLNDDFFGSGISPEDSCPSHLFKIANHTPQAVLALPLGLISRYGEDYQNINYLVKLNGKTNLGVNEDKDSSGLWWTVEDVLKFKKQSNLKIVAVGYTVYLGGKYEAKMLAEAAQMVKTAHQNGLLTLIWMYPRTKGLKEDNIHTIAGGAGVAAALGTDFVKIKYPYNSKNKKATAIKFKEATEAAGRTRVICVGGQKRSTASLLEEIKLQLKFGGTHGIAIGRNIHQLSLADALRFTAKISQIIFPEEKKKNKTDSLNFF